MMKKTPIIKAVLAGSKSLNNFLLILAILLCINIQAAADNTDYRSEGQENWVRFTFVLIDSQSGKPLNGRVYYQSDIASDWFHPDNTRPLLPPGTYRILAWERHYWQAEQTLNVNPKKGVQQQVVINLDPVSSPRDGKPGSLLRAPSILSSLLITGNTLEKEPHMNDHWFGQSGMATFSIRTNAKSEFSGGAFGNRSSTAGIDYYFYLMPEDARNHFDRLRPGFKQGASKSQTVTGPAPVSLGDEALMISVDTVHPGGKGLLYETRRYLILYGHFVVNLHTHREVGLDFLISPEEVLKRIRALDIAQVKRMVEPEPYPWPKIIPDAKAISSALTEVQPPDADEAEAELPPETVLAAVAGGSIVLALGALIQLWGMGGFQNVTGLRSLIESLVNAQVTEPDLAGTQAVSTESPPIEESSPLPAEPDTALPQIALPDPIPIGFEYQGKVWAQPPWDRGGPFWMDKNDYNAMRSNMREGKVWSDRWGWVKPEEGKALEAQNAEDWNKYTSSTDEDIKILTDRIKESQERLNEIREKQAELERIEQLRERLSELEKQRVMDNSFASRLSEIWKSYSDGVNRDLDALPGELLYMARDAARTVRDTTGAVIRELTDVHNYQAAARAAVDTAKDLILHPVDSSVRVGNIVKSTGGAAINVAAGIASDPVGFAEGVVGLDNWKRVIDPNVAVGERVCRALYGAVDTALNFASGGTRTAATGVEAGIDALKAANTASEASKTAKVLDRIPVRLDDPARIQAWEAGRLAGRQKADQLADALKSGDASEVKKALIECQQDKHAISVINKGDEAVRSAYNQQMKQLITDDVDQVMKQKIAQRYGVDPKDVELFEVSNPSAKVKVGADRDFTIRVKARPGEIVPDPNKPGNFIEVKPGDTIMKDVPAGDSQAIYNRELYSKVTGEPIPTDPERFRVFQAEADKLAHNMDHVAGNRVGTESYGSSQHDLDTILQKSGGRFTDPEQAGNLATYKSTHLYQQAEDIAKINPEKAEALISDGMRQTTKQYDNLITTRVRALEGQGMDVALDQRLTRAVEILKKVEYEGLAPSKVEAILRAELNMSKDDAAQMLGGQLARLHHMRPKQG